MVGTFVSDYYKLECEIRRLKESLKDSEILTDTLLEYNDNLEHKLEKIKEEIKKYKSTGRAGEDFYDFYFYVEGILE